MKKVLALVLVAATLGATTLSFDAEAARRLGGGKSTGMQRQSTPPAAQPGTPANNTNAASPTQAAPAAGATAAAAAPAAAARRSWMGPIAGIAAGLGLAALASHFGFGEALANMLTMVLIGVAVLAVIGFVMRKRMQGAQPAFAGGGAAPSGGLRRDASPSLIGSGLAAPAAAAPIPAGFDAPAFERNARDQFMTLQAAHDAGDLERIRDHVTPELFDQLRADIQSRGGEAQKTEVFGLEARVLEVVEDGPQYVVSVRFTGSVRDEPGATPEDLDETWHLVKPRTGFGGWVIAGIQQAGAPH